MGHRSASHEVAATRRNRDRDAKRYVTNGKGKRVDQRFGFLSKSQSAHLLDIVSRRNRHLFERLRSAGAVSRSDAEEIVNALGDELANNMDDDWEPTEYGQTVSALLARFNAARIAEWPG